MAERHSTPKIPASSQVRVKKEQDEDDSDSSLCTTVKKLELKHSHRFKFKFSGKLERYSIDCDHPRTVLEALKTNDNYNARGYSDESVMISLFRAEKQVAISTHFPCHLIKNDDLLVIDHKPGKVVEAQHEARPSLGEGEYEYVKFFIDTRGGKNATEKYLFRHNAVKKFDYLCVYAEKGMTVGQAFKRDGRFNDDLDKFRLSDKEDPDHEIEDHEIEHTQIVDNLSGKYFKICLDHGQELKKPWV